MFMVLLKFAENKASAAQFMDGHKDWIQRGFDEGVFLMAGSLQPNLGGSLMAYNTTRPALEARVQDDPFVAENVVSAEILDITPARTDARLDFLKD